MNKKPGRPESPRGRATKSRTGFKKNSSETSREARFDKPRSPRSEPRGEGYSTYKKTTRTRPETRSERPFDKPFRKKTTDSSEPRGYRGKPRDADKDFSRDRKYEPREQGDRSRGFEEKRSFRGKPRDTDQSFSRDRKYEPREQGDMSKSFDEKRGFKGKPRDTDQSFSRDRKYEPREQGDRSKSFDEKRGFRGKPRDTDQSFSRDRKYQPREQSDGDRGFVEKRGFRGKPRDTDQSFSRERKYEPREQGDRKKGFDDKRSFGEKKYSERPKRNFDNDRNFENKEGRDFQKRGSFQTERPSRWNEDKPDRPSASKKGSRVIDDTIRLNRYIANAGICSRREADTLIVTGAISVNGEIVTELGTKVKPTDTILYGSQRLKNEKKVYILLNKPKDFITTSDDPMERKTVMDLVQNACPERVYPVGRLDRNTTGLLLLTNDGDLAKKLTHPKHGVLKLYQVTLDRALSIKDLEDIGKGVKIDDTLVVPDEIAYIDKSDSKKEIGIAIHSGQNRIVRRIFENFDYRVEKLDRVMFAGLTKRDLPRGKWRFLSLKEVSFLKMVK